MLPKQYLIDYALTNIRLRILVQSWECSVYRAWFMLYNLNFLLCSYYVDPESTLVCQSGRPKWHQIQSVGIFLMNYLRNLDWNYQKWLVHFPIACGLLSWFCLLAFEDCLHSPYDMMPYTERLLLKKQNTWYKYPLDTIRHFYGCPISLTCNIVKMHVSGDRDLMSWIHPPSGRIDILELLSFLNL